MNRRTSRWRSRRRSRALEPQRLYRDASMDILGGARLRVGMVGVGRIGAFHARTLLSLDPVESVTLADLDPARSTTFATEIGAASAPTPEALVDANIGALVVAAPTPAHRELLALAA